jgi:uncharacterized membrane protein (DUF485 family)
MAAGSNRGHDPRWLVPPRLEVVAIMAKRRVRRTTPRRARLSEHEVYEQIAGESDFAELRRRYRRFAFPATVAFMVWYITYVVCNLWARDFMNTPVIGNINIALVFGLLQFASTFLIAYFYSRYSTKNLDPPSDKLRAEFESELSR